MKGKLEASTKTYKYCGGDLIDLIREDLGLSPEVSIDVKWDSSDTSVYGVQIIVPELITDAQ